MQTVAQPENRETLTQYFAVRIIWEMGLFWTQLDLHFPFKTDQLKNVNLYKQLLNLKNRATLTQFLLCQNYMKNGAILNFHFKLNLKFTSSFHTDQLKNVHLCKQFLSLKIGQP